MSSWSEPFVPLAKAAAIGAVLWIAAAALSGRREAWDAPVYWLLAYPLSLLACAFLGRAYPAHPRRWAFVLFGGQFVAMCFRNGEFGNLLPLGVVVFGILALPGVLVASLAARSRLRSAGKGAE